MFRKSYNRAVIGLRVETVTPLLIRAGDAGLDPTAADLVSVRTRHARFGKTVYIPGSSLKGVLRSAAEASVRGQRFAGSLEGACDPLSNQESCGRKMRELNPRQFAVREQYTAAVYRGHCMACRTFGSTEMKGRFSIRDLFPFPVDCADPGGLGNFQQANRLEERHAVSIDRVMGSVKNGPFDMEMVPAGVSFWGEIALENYQVWQLGLLAQGIDEVARGLAQLGSSKSRGLGVARVEVVSILHEQNQRVARPVGVGALATVEELEQYGLLGEEALPAEEGTQSGLYLRFTAREPGAWMKQGLDALGGLL